MLICHPLIFPVYYLDTYTGVKVAQSQKRENDAGGYGLCVALVSFG